MLLSIVKTLALAALYTSTYAQDAFVCPTRVDSYCRASNIHSSCVGGVFRSDALETCQECLCGSVYPSCKIWAVGLFSLTDHSLNHDHRSQSSLQEVTGYAAADRVPRSIGHPIRGYPGSPGYHWRPMVSDDQTKAKQSSGYQKQEQC